MDYFFKNTGIERDQLNEYSKLLSLVFSETKKYSVEFLEWQYSKNPSGHVVGFDAFHNGQLVGHYVTIPVYYLFGGEKIKGLLSLNTATHPEHQGKGLFTKLADRTYEYASSNGFKFVIGVANQNSTPGFIRKLGFTLLSPLHVNIFVGKAAAQEISSDCFQSYWNDELANWRLGNPAALYYQNTSGPVSKTHISSILAVLSQRKIFHKSNSLKSAGSLLKMTIGLNLKKNGLLKINLPDKMKPSPLNLIFKKLTPLPFEPTVKTIYFELIDFDAY